MLVAMCSKTIDTNGDGMVTKEEFKRALLRMDLAEYGWQVSDGCCCYALAMRWNSEIDSTRKQSTRCAHGMTVGRDLRYGRTRCMSSWQSSTRTAMVSSTGAWGSDCISGCLTRVDLRCIALGSCREEFLAASEMAGPMQQHEARGHDDEAREHDEDEQESHGATQVASASAKVAAAKAELQALLAVVEDVDVSSHGAAEEVEAAMGGVRRSMQSLTALASRR